MSAATGIATALLLGVLCTLLAFRRSGALQTTLRLLLSALSAVLLWLALFPPAGMLSTPSQPQTLVLLSAESDLQRAAQLKRAGALVLALPEASQSFAHTTTSNRSDFEPVADLQAALRRYPQASELHILGRGLPARDQRARLGLPVRFEPPPEPAGLRHWSVPAAVTAGSLWSVSGEVGGLADASVVLLDPAGARVATAPVDAAGHFSLSTRVRSAGRMLYTLEVWTDQSPPALSESVQLPVIVEPAAPAKVLLLAGAPSPELKYLRRWAVDAGLALTSRMALGLNMQIGAARPPNSAAEWREFDLLVLDERSLAALGSAGRQNVEVAVREGMGLLLRLTGSLGSAEAAWLQSLGLTVKAADLSSTVPWAVSEGSLPLQQRPLTVDGPLVLPLLSTPAGSRVGAWQPLGLGRVGVLWLTDSYQLQLNGFAELHASLWQQAFGSLQRGRANPLSVQRQSADPVRVDQRSIWCGLDPQRHYTLHSAANAPTQLLIDPATPGCAAAWPGHGGWAELRDDQGLLLPLYVHPPAAAPAQLARQQAQATLAMALASSAPEVVSNQHDTAAPAWPWWLAWLLSTCLLWLLERRGWTHQASG